MRYNTDAVPGVADITRTEVLRLENALLGALYKHTFLTLRMTGSGAGQF